MNFTRIALILDFFQKTGEGGKRFVPKRSWPQRLTAGPGSVDWIDDLAGSLRWHWQELTVESGCH
jgi:hypothetical protein